MIPPEITVNSTNFLKQEYDLDIMSLPLREAREIFESRYLQRILDLFGNNISKTASFVGMERSALHRKLKLLGLNISTRKSGNEEFDDPFQQESNSQNLLTT
jgi:two-component system nitrogen regulation response regulator NtrX